MALLILFVAAATPAGAQPTPAPTTPTPTQTPIPVSPPTAEHPWMLGAAVQFDDASNDSLFATFTYGATATTWLAFSAGRSRSPAELADVVADTFSASVDQRFGPMGLSFEAERWGDSDALTSDDLALGVYFVHDFFRIGAKVEARDIEIPFTITGPLGRTQERTAETDADGLVIELGLEPAPLWSLYMRGAEYDYERDLAILPRIDRLNLLSTSTLTLANALLEEQLSLGVERRFSGARAFNFSAARDRSAVDGERYESAEVALLLPIGNRVDLEANLGYGRSSLATDVWYGGVLFLVYGGR